MSLGQISYKILHFYEVIGAPTAGQIIHHQRRRLLYPLPYQPCRPKEASPKRGISISN